MRLIRRRRNDTFGRNIPSDEEPPNELFPNFYNIPDRFDDQVFQLRGSQEKSTVIILILVGLAFTFVKIMDGRLPDPAPEHLNTMSSNIRFSEDHTRKYLEDLLAVGPRVSGSEAADVITVQKLMDMLTEIKNSHSGNYNLNVEIQRPYGAIGASYSSRVYLGIVNVVAKLEAKDVGNRSDDSILVNCHFDSGPGSPGATDATVTCAAMLEVINLMYRSSGEVAKNSIVFLFNGAEEITLLGSHGFVKGKEEGKKGRGHLWSNNIRTFINLEGAGVGGREILFQTGPNNGWLMNVYSKATPHPYGVVLAEEIFQADLIPSSTDFWIFNYFLQIPGLDMTAVKNGWLYHTKWDKMSEIPPGSIQHLGDNLLGLVTHLGIFDFNELEPHDIDSRMVYFDLFGVFMVCYTEYIGMVLNFVAAACFILIVFIEVFPPFSLKGLRTFFLLPVSAFIAWAISIGVGILSGFFLNSIGFYRPYQSYPFMALIIIGLPAFFAQTLTYSLFWRGSREKCWLAGKFMMAISICCVTVWSRTTFVMTMILIFAILSWLLRRLIFKNAKIQHPAEVSLSLVIGELFPFMYTLSLTLTLTDVFVPTLGRSPHYNPTMFMGILASLTTSIFTLQGIGTYFVSMKKSHLVLWLLGTTFILNPLLCMGFIGKIPFMEKTPMRLWILDTDRTWYNADMTENKTDAGYWFWPEDPNTWEFLPEISKTVPELRNYRKLNVIVDSCDDLYCSQPLYLRSELKHKEIPWVQKSSNLPSSLKDTVQIRIKANEEIRKGVRNITLVIQGPAQSSIALRPAPNWSVRRWTMSAGGGVVDDVSYPGRSKYFIALAKGYTTEDCELTVTLQKVLNSFHATKSQGELMDVMLVGHIMYDTNERNFKDFIQRLPSWTHVTSWTSVVKQYKINEGIKA